MEEKLVALRRAGARAVPLAGRGVARPSRSANNDERAARVFQRWQKQHPFESGDWFERRLAADGTDPEGLRALLAESPDAVADRLGSPEPWIDRLVASFRCPPAPMAIPAEHAFASLVAPLLATARDRR
jgi:hypothetical protein